MKSVAKIPTAGEINEAHRLAKSCAETAINHAVKCGELLTAAKANLGPGEFDLWVAKNCDFGRSSAYAYMKAATRSSSTLDGFSSLRQALGYDKKPEPRKFEPEFTRGAVPVVKAPEGATGETGDDRPAAPIPEGPAPEVLRPDWEPDEDEDAQLALAEKDYEARVDQVMQADDALTEARAQIQQQSALIATLTLSRDGYLSGKNEVVKLLKKEQRKNDRLHKQLKAAQHEIEQLRERIAIKDEAA